MASKNPDERAVLERLDASAKDEWPRFNGGIGTFEYHAMRMLVARERKGPGWGIVWECVLGDYLGDPEMDPYGAGIHYYTCGSKALGARVAQEPFPLTYRGDTRASFDGTELVAKAGKLKCKDSMIDALDLRPGRTTTDYRKGRPADPRFILLVRAYLARYPGSLWGDTQRALSLLDLGDSDLLVESDSFEHVVGPSKQPLPSELKRFAILPSASATYRSVAATIARRDAKAFVPGASNLDWRTWAIYPEGKSKTQPSKAKPTPAKQAKRAK